VQDMSDKYGKCVLGSECKSKKCGNDVYVLHGYSEIGAEAQIKSIAIESDTRNVYHCYLPYSKCEYDIPCAIKALNKEVDKHSKGKKIDLVGLSFSGMLSQFYALEHPNKVGKMALVFSFSKIHDPYMVLRMFAKNPKHTKKLMDYDLSKLKHANIPNPTLAIDCRWDSFFIGDPPVIKNGSHIQIDNCLHHHHFIPEKTRDKIKEFLEGSSVGL